MMSAFGGGGRVHLGHVQMLVHLSVMFGLKDSFRNPNE